MECFTQWMEGNLPCGKNQCYCRKRSNCLTDDTTASRTTQLPHRWSNCLADGATASQTPRLSRGRSSWSVTFAAWVRLRLGICGQSIHVDRLYLWTNKQPLSMNIWERPCAFQVEFWISNFMEFDSFILKCPSNPKVVSAKNRNNCKTSQLCPNWVFLCLNMLRMKLKIQAYIWIT